MKEFTKDQLEVKIYKNRREMGEEAARMMGERIRRLLAEQAAVNIVFASAPSQNDFLAALSGIPGIEWSRVNAFHMDEYIGLPGDHPQGFGYYLKTQLFDKLPFLSVHYLNGEAADPRQECDRYASLLAAFPTDIACLGIGENTHIAFNDPHVANFRDPYRVKVVDLDTVCRQQQVNDGCFSSIGEVPTHALTLTVPALLSARYIYCVVPGPSKAQAVYHTLSGEISEQYPSTSLRTHEQAVLFLDEDSADRIKSQEPGTKTDTT